MISKASGDKAETESAFTEAIPGEMEAAHKKVIIKKCYDSEAEKKIFNLNSVSASCPVMNL